MGAWFLMLLQIDDDIRTIGQELAVWLLENTPRILGALIVLALALWIDDRVQGTVERIVGRDAERRELARLLGRTARFGVLLLALIVVLAIFKQTAIVASFMASLGIAGLVLAFALQDITKNLAAGVLLLILRPFRLDDQIKVRDFEGTVADISLRATALRTVDGTEVLLPNADVYTSPITNLTRYSQRRHHVALSLPATLPIEPTRQRLEAALRAMPGLEYEPQPEVVATTLEGDAVTLDVRFWLPSDVPDAPIHISAVIEQLRSLVAQIKDEAAKPATVSPDHA